MFFALIEGTDKRIHIDDVVMNDKEIQYICPICHGDLIIKNGSVKTPHFAHKSLEECDTFTSDMSEWHKNWQNVFPKKNQEIVLEIEMKWSEYVYDAVRFDFKTNKNYKRDDKNTIKIKHRADVLACGYVIEFQHSPISKSEFNERNWFYNECCGYKVIWIFDFIDSFDVGRLECYGEWYGKQDNGGKYHWKYAYRTFDDFIQQDEKEISIFFQYSEDIEGEDATYIEKLK